MCRLVMMLDVWHLAMPLSVLALLVLPGSAQGPLNATLVSSAKGLADTLSNFHVENIYLNGAWLVMSRFHGFCSQARPLALTTGVLAVHLSRLCGKAAQHAGTVTLTSGTWKPIGGTVTVVDRSVNISTRESRCLLVS